MKRSWRQRCLGALLALALTAGLVPAQGAEAPEKTEARRYTVLVLDASDHMSGIALASAQAAADQFVDAALAAEGENYVAVVAYRGTAAAACPLSRDAGRLHGAIRGLTAGGPANVAAGLEEAGALLDGVTGPGVRNVLLMSSGLADAGRGAEAGPFRAADHPDYRRANEASRAAEALGKGAYLYSLGFFHSLPDGEIGFAQRFLKELENAGYYEVGDPDSISYIFERIVQEGTKKSGRFRYPISNAPGADGGAAYYYDDAYFYHDAYRYDPSLATMSLCLAMSAFGSNEEPSYRDKSKNARALLTELGFTDIETNGGFQAKPTRDSIGVVAARKELALPDGTACTLLAVAVRGGGYESEWASNFTIGAYGFHQGFSEARNQVLLFLRGYVADPRHRIEGRVKLWLTGYSRAAATSNLLAGALDSGTSLGACELAPRDLYAYCFETPAGMLSAEVPDRSLYENIFNIVNPSDPVPKVAPQVWGFGRYGVDKKILFPENGDRYLTARNNMLLQYHSLNGMSYYAVDDFQMKRMQFFSIVDDTESNLSQSRFLDISIANLANDLFKSRSHYVAKFQDDIRKAAGVISGMETEQKEAFMDLLFQKIMDNALYLTFLYVSWGIPAIIGPVAGYIAEALTEVGIYDYTGKEIHELALTLVPIVVLFLAGNINLTVTACKNLDGIKEAHYPELCLAWLRSMDPNYTENAQSCFAPGGYRQVRVNCPVDVEVFNKDTGALVARIQDDMPAPVEGSSIPAGLNLDGEKTVTLPADGNYRVRLTATGGGVMSYSVDEYSYAYGRVNRFLNYEDIPIKTGDVLTGDVPVFRPEEMEMDAPEGSSTAYTLTGADGRAIPPDREYRGDDALDAYRSISAACGETPGGLVMGGGSRQLGSYAKLSVLTLPGYRFDGWYAGGELVSTGETYRFRVEEDKALTAEFTANSYPLTPEAEAGGRIVTPETGGTYQTGESVPLEAKADSGYRFLGWTSEPSGMFDDPHSAGTVFLMPPHAATVTVHFEAVETGDGQPARTYSIQTSASAGGRIDPGQADVRRGGSQTFTITPEEGYRIADVLADGRSVGKVGTYTFDLVFEDHTLAASFKMLQPFSDVQAGDWYHKAVMWGYDNDIIRGAGDGLFHPAMPLDRAMFAQLLAGLEGADLTGYGQSPFSDVDMGQWYGPAVSWAAACGIADGTGRGLFEPARPISREEMATMLYRYLRWKGLTPKDRTVRPLSDLAAVSGWALESVTALNRWGIVLGNEQGAFLPRQTATKAEAAALFMRFAERT